MSEAAVGNILLGDDREVRRSAEHWAEQAVDQDIPLEEGGNYESAQTTLADPVSVTGPGTFFGKAKRTLTFVPSREDGWWLDRQDLPGSLPIRVSVHNVWTTVRNIVLCSGSPHNYLRIVEHIIALRLGMGLDNVVIRVDSGDPPLFDRSSMDLVEAVERARIVPQGDVAPWVTVKEPVTVGGANGSFLTLLPAEPGVAALFMDCAVDFRSAIGKQRIRFRVSPGTFRRGAGARTNCTLAMVLYFKTIGKIFADTRNLGYNPRNILVAGRWRYVNEPGLMHEGKSLEAVWHRATLDLLAALALIDRGRLAGRIISYKAGHSLDVQLVRELYQRDLLEPFRP